MTQHNFKHISFNYLSDNFGSDSSVWFDIVTLACDDLSTIVAEMVRSQQNGNYIAMGELAHQLKGVVQIFDRNDLGNTLKDLQIDGLAQKNTESFGKRVAEINTEVEAIISELKQLIP